jgi:hypothetical protein
MKIAPLAVAASLLAACASEVTLVEGYCQNGEADRCYFDHPVMDGF